MCFSLLLLNVPVCFISLQLPPHPGLPVLPAMIHAVTPACNVFLMLFLTPLCQSTGESHCDPFWRNTAVLCCRCAAARRWRPSTCVALKGEPVVTGVGLYREPQWLWPQCGRWPGALILKGSFHFKQIIKAKTKQHCVVLQP